MKRRKPNYEEMVWAVWKAMKWSPDRVWSRARVAQHARKLNYQVTSPTEIRMMLEEIDARHPGFLRPVPGRMVTYEVIPDRPEPFSACRSTQHCAYHGWCHRCAPESFDGLMRDVNHAIADGGASDSLRGPLYEEISKVLKEHLLDGD